MPRAAHSISSYKLGGPDGCQHAWARRYLDDERPPEPTWEEIESGLIVPKGTERSRALGTAVHGVEERHARLVYGFPWPDNARTAESDRDKPIDWESTPGRIAHAALPYFPDINTSRVVGIESAIGRVIVPGAAKGGEPGPVLYVHGVPFAGFVDLEWLLLELGRIKIRDYKSTSNLRFALTAAELEAEPQGAMYAIDALEREHRAGRADRADRPGRSVPADASVDLSWLYLRTRGNPAAHEVQVVQTYSRAIEIMGPVAETCRELDLIPDSASAPKNPRACTNYGGRPGAIGCPYHPELGGNCTVKRTFATIAASKAASDRQRRERSNPKSIPDPDPVAPKPKPNQKGPIMPLSQATLAKFNRTPAPAPDAPPTEDAAPVDPVADTEPAPETAAEPAPEAQPAKPVQTTVSPATTPAAKPAAGAAKAKAKPPAAGSVGGQIAALAAKLSTHEAEIETAMANAAKVRAEIAALLA